MDGQLRGRVSNGMGDKILVPVIGLSHCRFRSMNARGPRAAGGYLSVSMMPG